MDDRLLGHRAFTDLSFTQKTILTIQIWPSTLLYFIYLCYQSTEIQMAIHSCLAENYKIQAVQWEIAFNTFLV